MEEQVKKHPIDNATCVIDLYNKTPTQDNVLQLGKLMAQMDGDGESEVSETKVVKDVLPISTNTSSSGSG